MSGPKDGAVTFHYRHALPRKVRLHVGAQQVPWVKNHQHAETEIILEQGREYTKLSISHDTIRIEKANPRKLDPLSKLMTTALVSECENHELAEMLRHAISRAFDSNGVPIKSRVRGAVKLTQYADKLIAGPHATHEAEEENISPRKHESGMNFDFRKSPFREKQTRLHIESSVSLDQALAFVALNLKPQAHIELNAEQTPKLSWLRPFNEDGPAYHKIQLSALEPETLRAQTLYPKNLKEWYDDEFKHPHSEVQSEKAATLLRKVIKHVLADEKVTEPEAKALAKFQEKLFEFISQFPVDKPPSSEEAKRIHAAYEAPLQKRANEAIAASLPPKPQTPRGRG